MKASNSQVAPESILSVRQAHSPSQVSEPLSGDGERRRGPSAGRSESFSVDGDIRLKLIAETAYYRAEERGFEPGHEEEDWLKSEAEIDALLMEGTTS